MTEVEARNAIRTLLTYIGENPDREGLVDTPKRVVRAWDEITRGYSLNPAGVLDASFSAERYDQMIICRDIEFYSTCEHHLLSFSGVAHVAYIPRKLVVGLSKMARLVDCFARRLQIQERMTQQIADVFQETLKPRGCGVLIEAKHLCMSCRGVQKHQASMVTTALHGIFRKAAIKSEFLDRCNGR